MENDNLFQIEKQKKILDYINEEKKATVSEISDLIDVSKVTVRKYLSELESKGLLIRTHGGVLSADSDLNNEIPYSSKKDLNRTEKQIIGKVASEWINEGDVVILDSGSTTFEIAQSIKDIKVTIITNDVKIAFELASKPNINLIITGGAVQKNLFTIVSFHTENFLKEIHVNKAFLGADGIDLEDGITNRTMEEVAIKQAMMKAADQVILVADHSKLGKRTFSNVCKIEQIDIMIMDSMDEEYQKAFREKGVNVVLAGG